MREGEKQKAFRELYVSNYSGLYHAALYFVNDSEAAKDIVNDVFSSLWDEYRKEGDIRQYTYAYLLRIVRSRCVDLMRHHEVENKYAMLYKHLWQNGILADDERKDERLEIIYKTLEEMPPRTRFVMEQCYFENKKYTEVAEILGLSRDGVRAHVMKGLALLRNVFSVNYKKGQ